MTEIIPLTETITTNDTHTYDAGPNKAYNPVTITTDIPPLLPVYAIGGIPLSLWYTSPPSYSPANTSQLVFAWLHIPPVPGIPQLVFVFYNYSSSSPPWPTDTSNTYFMVWRKSPTYPTLFPVLDTPISISSSTNASYFSVPYIIPQGSNSVIYTEYSLYPTGFTLDFS